MKSSWFYKKEHYEFAKCLKGANYSLTFYNIFHDFIHCAAIALQQPVQKLRTGRINDELEQEYLQIVNKHKGYSETFPEALYLLTKGLEEDMHDFLGSVSGAIGANSKGHGQCFTPWELCKLSAEMVLGNTKPQKRRILLNEPACGGGAMVLATVETLRELGFGPRNYYFIAQDIDIKCFHMSYIQLSLCGVPASIIWGDLLKLENRMEWVTFVGTLYPWIEQEEESVTLKKAVRTRKRL